MLTTNTKTTGGKKTVRRYSAGGAVYKRQDHQLYWLLIRPKKRPGSPSKVRWQLPKGWIEEGEKSIQAAVREVEEEGGVKARVIDKIDEIKIFFKNTFEDKPEETVFKTITFYLMEYISDSNLGPDEEVEEVAWETADEAEEKLSFRSEKQVLRKAGALLERSQYCSQETLF